MLTVNLFYILVTNLLNFPFLVALYSLSSFYFSAFWRQAGMTYLDYLSVSSKAVRNSLKEPARTKAASRGGFFYNKTTGPASGAEKVPIQG